MKLYLEGYLSGDLSLLADKKVGIFVIYTLNSGYVLVKVDKLDSVKDCLQHAGYVFTK